MITEFEFNAINEYLKRLAINWWNSQSGTRKSAICDACSSKSILRNQGYLIGSSLWCDDCFKEKAENEIKLNPDSAGIGLLDKALGNSQNQQYIIPEKENSTSTQLNAKLPTIVRLTCILFLILSGYSLFTLINGVVDIINYYPDPNPHFIYSSFILVFIYKILDITGVILIFKRKNIGAIIITTVYVISWFISLLFFNVSFSLGYWILFEIISFSSITILLINYKSINKVQIVNQSSTTINNYYIDKIKEEARNIVQDMNPDKYVGSDGFNNIKEMEATIFMQMILKITEMNDSNLISIVKKQYGLDTDVIQKYLRDVKKSN